MNSTALLSLVTNTKKILKVCMISSFRVWSSL